MKPTWATTEPQRRPEQLIIVISFISSRRRVRRPDCHRTSVYKCVRQQQLLSPDQMNHRLNPKIERHFIINVKQSVESRRLTASCSATAPLKDVRQTHNEVIRVQRKRGRPLNPIGSKSQVATNQTKPGNVSVQSDGPGFILKSVTCPSAVL